MTSLVDQRTGEIFAALSTSARFDSIVRGVIDAGDLIYHAGLALAFLAANTFVLERERWARHESPRRVPRHRRWRTETALVVANAVALKLWVGQLDGARLDTTAGGHYTTLGRDVEPPRGSVGAAPAARLLQQAHAPAARHRSSPR